jgi:hypothetical protein
MKIQIPVMTEKTIATIRVSVPVNYDEDDMPNNYPHRKGNVWAIDIDAVDGQIRGWPPGVAPLHLSMKVVDEGSYEVLDENGGTILKVDQNYVPDWIPGEYGDYIDFKISSGGRIENWPNTQTLADMIRVEAYEQMK